MLKRIFPLSTAEPSTGPVVTRSCLRSLPIPTGPLRCGARASVTRISKCDPIHHRAGF